MLLILTLIAAFAFIIVELIMMQQEKKMYEAVIEKVKNTPI
jgi:uncharacterized protein YoxC